jgi:nicotinamide phosphoribosyltransferase
MFKPNTLFYTDGYKIGHKRMLATGTKKLYGSWIPRSLKHIPSKTITKIVSFGQQLTVRWLHDEFNENFFSQPKDVAIKFSKDMSSYLGMSFDGTHFEDLHNLGYLPFCVKSLPEGIETLPNIPHMTFINTKDGFGWLTLYLETIISSLAWKPSTSATIAKQYRRNTFDWVNATDTENLWLVDYMCHDFSARGLSPWDMLSSGLGHATSHRGSDTIICIPGARYFYDESEDEVCINSVNASEHSVSTTKIFTVGEKQMLIDWMTEFPEGILSVVMDTLDLTKVVKPGDGYLEELKELVITRNGKLVIRPDSCPNGLTPVDIICGHNNELSDRENDAYFPGFYNKGLIECLWDIFGGTINKQGYKVLDPHIGAIYGDSINLDRQVEIYRRLAEKGFAATNIVLGVGSFTYQFTTRDTMGFAAKGCWFETEDASYDIYKDPVTDDGTKKSKKGLLAVHLVDGEYELKDQCTEEEESAGELKLIYKDGKFFNQTTLKNIREKLF